MIKVLRILNRINLGGPVHNVTFLTKYLPQEFETRLLVGVKEDDEEDAGFVAKRLGLEYTEIPELRRSINFKRDRAAYQHIKRIIREYKPDIVHTHAAKSGTIGRLAAAACKVPVIVHTFHGHVFHSYFGKAKTQFYLNIERYLARRSTGIIAISDLQKHELGDVFRVCSPEKIRVIPLGFDLDKFATDRDAKRAAFRHTYLLEEDEIAVGIVGRMAPVKNHPLFVDAAVRVAAASSKRLRFFLIGDGEDRATIEALFHAKGMDYTYWPEAPRRAAVTCTSWQHDMDVVTAGLDVVVLTSHNEGTPVSLIEAQAAGSPVVSTDVGGVRDVVADGVSGLIVPPGDVEGVSNALLYLTEDAKRRSEMGVAGQANVLQRFSYHRLVDDMTAYYHELLGR